MSQLFQRSFLAVIIASSVLSTPLSTGPILNVEPSTLTLAPLVVADHPHGSINNSYIVLLKDEVPPSIVDSHMNFLLAAHNDDPLVGDDFAGINHIYEGHITGYAGRFTDRVIEQIRRMPEVQFVEKDQIVRTQETQRGAPWVRVYSHSQAMTNSPYRVWLASATVRSLLSVHSRNMTTTPMVETVLTFTS